MASRLPAGWVDELRARVEIVDVVADYVELKQKGRRFWGRCPFHNEKTPSFSVDSESQMYYCFGCHKGGTVINFVMDIEHMEFMDTVRMLAERVHMPMPALVAGPRDDTAAQAQRERIYEANTEAARFYHNCLWTAEGAEALSYLHRRGLDDAGIRRFGLGSTPALGDGLTRALIDKGFDAQTLVQAGLTRENEGRRYDVFRNRAIFPIINAQGKVLGFGGRVMGEGNPKYLNTSDTPVFNKRQGLYAMNFVRKERGLKRLILVEGYMDVVSLRQKGVQGVVATLGTALTDEQARLIKRYVPEVWVCYDGDSAGQKAILRALDIFEAQDMPCRVIDIPGGQDPDEYVTDHGLEGFEALKPIQPVRYRMLRAAEAYDLGTQDGRTQYAIKCCEFLRAVKNPVEMENYLRDLALQTGFERDVLLRQVGQAQLTVSRQAEAQAHRQSAPWRRPEAPPDYVKAEQLLVGLLASGQLGADAVPTDLFVTDLYRGIASQLLGGAAPAAIIEQLDGEDRSQAAQALMQELPIDRDKVDQALADCIEKIGQHKRKQRIDQLREQIRTETDAQRKNELIKLLSQLMNETNGSISRPGTKE